MQSIAEHIGRILSDFFNPEQVRELTTLIKKEVPESAITEFKDLLSLTPENYNPAIDILITYASDRLETSRHVELLLQLGEFSISIGELKAATEVYNHIFFVTDEHTELENVQAYSYLALGDIYSRQAEWQNSIRYLNKAKKLFTGQKDFRGSARCENILGTIYGDKGEIKKAKKHFEESLSYLDQKQDEYLIGMIEINLGIINNIQGNYDQAFTYHQRAIYKFEQMQDFRRLSEVLNNLGMMHTQKGEYDLALKVYDQSISVSLSSGYLPTLVVSYLSKGYIYALLKDITLAQAFSDKGMEGAIKLNDRLSVADIYKTKGIIEKKFGNFVAAENYLVTSIRINQELENILNLAESSLELGILYIEFGKKESALEQLNNSLNYFKKLDSLVMIEKITEIIKGIR